MAVDLAAERSAANRCRYRRGAPQGHYESYFQRANHPARALAFWIRYTIFSPLGRPQDAVGELWAIYFDGETGRITAAKQSVPIASCDFSPDRLHAAIGSARLDHERLGGAASSGSHRLEWSLEYRGGERPLLLLPRSFYDRGFPKAKALVGSPNAVFHGKLIVDGESVAIDAWQGSQNHNWGSKHTDAYAWGQVAGFDNAGDAFLECSTARLRVGPLWTPPLTVLVLRVGGEEYALNGLAQALRARGEVNGFDWRIDSRSPTARVTAHIHAPASAFVGLRYDNPPGGAKTCLNSKLAACELTLERPGHAPLALATKDRAAFEILTDRSDHGIAVVA